MLSIKRREMKNSERIAAEYKETLSRRMVEYYKRQGRIYEKMVNGTANVYLDGDLVRVKV